MVALEAGTFTLEASLDEQHPDDVTAWYPAAASRSRQVSFPANTKPPQGGFFIGANVITIPFKRGDTFKLACAYSVDGVPSALPPGIRAQVRDRNDALIAAMDVTRTDPDTGLYVLAAPGTTDAWPVTLLFCDIEYTDADANISSTETFALNIVADVTK